MRRARFPEGGKQTGPALVPVPERVACGWRRDPRVGGCWVEATVDGAISTATQLAVEGLEAPVIARAEAWQDVRRVPKVIQYD